MVEKGVKCGENGVNGIRCGIGWGKFDLDGGGRRIGFGSRERLGERGVRCWLIVRVSGDGSSMALILQSVSKKTT